MTTIYERLSAFNKNRLPDMVKLKYKTMSEDVFSFYRGTCHLFYQDLSAEKGLPPSPATWVCGDLHLENFGSFKADNNQVYFDLNDFDEALLAPAAWELTRMVTSIFIECTNLKLKSQEAMKIAHLFLESYSNTLKKGKAVGIDPRTADGIVSKFLTAVKKRKQKELLKKHALGKKGKFKELITNEKQIALDNDLKEELAHHINTWIKKGNYGCAHFKVIDSVFRIAGTGSEGVKRYLLLLESQESKKYLLLDMKRAYSSSLQPYIRTPQPSWDSEADRIVAIQQRLQNVSPAVLGATVFKTEPYVVQQMQPTEDKIDFDLIKNKANNMNKAVQDMATLTASAQLRSSGRQGSAIADELILFGQNNEWQGPVLKYATKYASRVKKNYREFMAGYKKGLYGAMKQ